jgi:peptidoglycan hydrolase-like protein with peptidoglycan-binding domain
MIIIKYGESGPRVVLLQILLNRKKANPKLSVDGIWGPKTEKAVETFRKSLGLKPAGPVDKDVFPKLLDGEGLQVVDSVDMGSIPYTDKKTGLPRNMDSGQEAAIEDLVAAGAHPLQMTRDPGQSVEHAVQKIINAVGTDEIALLRFHGHGNHGTWFTIAASDPVDLKEEDPAAYKVLAADWHGYLDLKHFDQHKLTLGKLTDYFAPFGSVEHHGCRVGSNSQSLMRKLAELWGVPVTAGRPDQYFGGGTSLAFEGTTFTAFPPATPTLKSWAASVKE